MDGAHLRRTRRPGTDARLPSGASLHHNSQHHIHGLIQNQVLQHGRRYASERRSHRFRGPRGARPRAVLQRAVGNGRAHVGRVRPATSPAKPGLSRCCGSDRIGGCLAATKRGPGSAQPVMGLFNLTPFPLDRNRLIGRCQRTQLEIPLPMPFPPPRVVGREAAGHPRRGVGRSRRARPPAIGGRSGS